MAPPMSRLGPCHHLVRRDKGAASEGAAEAEPTVLTLPRHPIHTAATQSPECSFYCAAFAGITGAPWASQVSSASISPSMGLKPLVTSA